MRRRLDVELVRRGLAPSRERARADIASGRVRVAGAVADKASRLVDPGEAVHVVGPAPRFASRGGEKLAGALERFAVGVTGLRCLDAGASTGGFTDCLLQAGAASVVAVDVGRGQMVDRLRSDPRVDLRERVNVRGLVADDIGGTVELVAADLSFISLRTVLPALLGLTAAEAPILALVKPQFEAGRADVSRGRGVVREPEIWRRVLGEVATTARTEGAAIMGCMVSPLLGADGNVEFFLHLSAPPPAGPRSGALTGEDIELLDAAVADARHRVDR